MSYLRVIGMLYLRDVERYLKVIRELFQSYWKVSGEILESYVVMLSCFHQ